MLFQDVAFAPHCLIGGVCYGPEEYKTEAEILSCLPERDSEGWTYVGSMYTELLLFSCQIMEI